MSTFSDSYYDPPDEAEEPCKICHYPEGQCTCPECTVCGEVGNPVCIGLHMFWKEWPHFRFQLSEAEQKAIKEREIMENITEQDAWAAIDKLDREEAEVLEPWEEDFDADVEAGNFPMDTEPKSKKE